MQQDQRKCQHCDSNLLVVDSIPPKWARTFIIRFLRASAVVFVLRAIVIVAKPEFYRPFDEAFVIIGLIIIAVLVQIPFFKRSRLITTYKCENCSRYSAINEIVE